MTMMAIAGSCTGSPSMAAGPSDVAGQLRRSLVRRAFRRGLQFDDCPPDLLPNGGGVEIAASEHLIGAFRGLDFGILPMPPNEKGSGAPDVKIRNHGTDLLAGRPASPT